MPVGTSGASGCGTVPVLLHTVTSTSLLSTPLGDLGTGRGEVGGGGLNLLDDGLRLGGGLSLLGITVHEEIDHDVPGLGAGDDAAHAEHLTGEEPVHQSQRVLGLVVAGDGDVNVGHRAVSVAEGNDGDVAVRRLQDGLLKEDSLISERVVKLRTS